MLGQWIEQATQQSQEAIAKALVGARNAMLGIRYHMRQMGEAAGVPVSSLFYWMLFCHFVTLGIFTCFFSLLFSLLFFSYKTLLFPRGYLDV